jgi:hypothetical protein
MKTSFAPLPGDARVFLSRATDIDFTAADFTNEDMWLCCTVYRPDGRIALVIVFEFKSPFDAHFTLAVADPKGLSRHLITTLYRTVFRRAARITALIDPHNQDALAGVARMGFQYEGLMRRGYNGKLDAAVWGLLPEECPYLRGRPFRIPPRVSLPLSASAVH